MGTGRKNPSGHWLRLQLMQRRQKAGMLTMLFPGILMGFALRDIPGAEKLNTVVMFLAAVLVVCGLWLYLKRLDATWFRGLEAERRVGDHIEHAVVKAECAYAHDVKEAVRASGNIDHVVVTPAGVWVVETKAGWLKKSKYRDALAQAAYSTELVRSHLKTPLPVRAALVLADDSLQLERDRDWKGQPVKTLDARAFWRVLRKEASQAVPAESRSELKRVVETVWDLGSSRHIGP